MPEAERRREGPATRNRWLIRLLVEVAAAPLVTAIRRAIGAGCWSPKAPGEGPVTVVQPAGSAVTPSKFSRRTAPWCQTINLNGWTGLVGDVPLVKLVVCVRLMVLPQATRRRRADLEQRHVGAGRTGSDVAIGAVALALTVTPGVVVVSVVEMPVAPWPVRCWRV